MLTTIQILVTEEWNHMFQPSEFFSYTKRPLRQETGRDDFVCYSDAYSTLCDEPVWFYSWGNARWLRCPIGRPGDRLNKAGDCIAAVDIVRENGQWFWSVSVKEAKFPAKRAQRP